MACDAFWRHKSMSTMALVMACCLTAPSHYMNQCWLIISQALWYSPKSNFIGIAEDINLGNKPDNYTFKIILASARGQWVNQYYRILARHEDVAYKYILNSMHCVSGNDYFLSKAASNLANIFNAINTWPCIQHSWYYVLTTIKYIE